MLSFDINDANTTFCINLSKVLNYFYIVIIILLNKTNVAKTYSHKKTCMQKLIKMFEKQKYKTLINAIIFLYLQHIINPCALTFFYFFFNFCTLYLLIENRFICLQSTLITFCKNKKKDD